MDAKNWFWIVGGNDDKVYSSAINTYIPASDPAYVAWLASGNIAGRPGTEAEIWGYVQDVLPSWLFDGTTFAQQTATSYTKAQLKAYSAAVRYGKETGGTTVNGASIATDRESQGLVERAYSMALRDSTFTTRWKDASGSFGPTIDAATIMAVGVAVGQHVAACFAVEASVSDQIDAGAIISLPQIDQAFASIV